MCLGIPGRIVEIWDERSGARMAHAEFATDASGGTEIRKLCLAYIPDLQIGEYTIVHAGFALTRVDELTALTTISTMDDYGVFGDEQSVPS